MAHDQKVLLPALDGTPPVGSPSEDPRDDRPLTLRPGSSRGDQAFRMVARAAGMVVLAIAGGIGLFLGIKSIPVFRDLGWSFLTTQEWNPETGKTGIAAVLVGTLQLAAVAITRSAAAALYRPLAGRPPGRVAHGRALLSSGPDVDAAHRRDDR